jgi:hypothetical protein
MPELNARWGSSVAKRGFKNEEDIADKFRNWREDSDAQEWLEIMGYRVDSVEELKVENKIQKVKNKNIFINMKTA